jgi:DNA-binding winged helix-turn-helix (wHTH) protein
MDAASDVYFRYAFASGRRLAYVSRAVGALTGYEAERFLADPAFCLSLVLPDDRRVVRQIVRARRPLSTSLRLRHNSGATVVVDIRTVPVMRSHKVVAIEGIVTAASAQLPFEQPEIPSEPTQQRLVALLYEVHGLLHGALGSRNGREQASRVSDPPTVLQVGDISIDIERMTVSLGGRPIALTTRELLVLRYFLRHEGRVITRQQLLADVWGYTYTGDDRTVDVHVSRLRRKLPPLRGMLRAIKHMGYKLERVGPPSASHSKSSGVRRIANI